MSNTFYVSLAKKSFTFEVKSLKSLISILLFLHTERQTNVTRAQVVLSLKCPLVDIFIFVQICHVHHDTDVAKKSGWTVDFLESRGLQGAFGSGILQIF